MEQKARKLSIGRVSKGSPRERRNSGYYAFAAEVNLFSKIDLTNTCHLPLQPTLTETQPRNVREDEMLRKGMKRGFSYFSLPYFTVFINASPPLTGL